MRPVYALCFACLLLLSPLGVRVVLPANQGLPAQFSAEMIGVGSMEPVKSMDLNGDSAPECVESQHGVVSIGNCSTGKPQVYWQSPAEWSIEQWTFSDLNRDGKAEVTLLVWRPFAPWPVERDVPGGGRIGSFHDIQGQSCHIILIGWRNGSFRELWAGSALSNPVIEIKAADIDRDGEQELITLRGDYDQPVIFRSGPINIWKWNGFGFDLTQTIDGSFRHLALIEKTQTWIVASQ